MANENLVSTGIGLRHVRAALRNGTLGVMAIPSTVGADTAYPGIQMSGAQALTLTVPDPQRVTARGDDRPFRVFSLPPTDLPTGELRVAKTNLTAIALLGGLVVFGSPTVRKVGFASDKTGEEPSIVLWGCREGYDEETEQRNWQTYFILNATAVAKPATMEDATVGLNTYAVTANMASQDELGVAFTILANGFLKCPYIMIVTTGKYWIDMFRAGGSTDDFVLTKGAAEIAAGGGVMNVTKNGVPVAYTFAGQTVTLTGGNPTAADVIAVEYEYVD